MAETALERLLSHAAMPAVRLWAGDLDPELPPRAANDTWPGNYDQVRWKMGVGAPTWKLFKGVSENVVYPIVPNGFHDHYPVFKWLFHWEY